MSHFVVLVITPQQPSVDALNEILLPWHEFECTGYDRYIVDIDKTEELRADFATDETSVVRFPDGKIVDAYDSQFYREPNEDEQAKIDAVKNNPFKRPDVPGAFEADWGDGKGHRYKVRFVPEGCEAVDVPTPLIKTFAQYLKDNNGLKIVPFGTSPDLRELHKYGWVEVDENGEVTKVIDRTNPNKKWDWWKLGGRWTSFLNPFYEPEKDPLNYELCFICRGTGLRMDDLGIKQRAEDPTYTCNGCGQCAKDAPRKGMTLKHAGYWRDVGNQSQKRDIPIAAIRDKAEAEAREEHRKVYAVLGDVKIVPWTTEYKDDPDWAKSREAFWEQPALKLMQKMEEGGHRFLWRETVNNLALTEDEYAQVARNAAMCPFAFVYEGKWYEKGSMGWFATVSAEKDANDWQAIWAKAFDNIADDMWLNVVDCHI
jgi:ferredoxin